MLLAALVLLTGFAPEKQEPKLDRKEAKKAFELVNDIRQNPADYRNEYELPPNLKINNTPLVWNEELAKAAGKKALDMAKRGYFGHVDPEGYGMNYHINKSGYKLIPAFLKNKSANNFESIAYGPGTGEDAIRILILDEGVPSKGHRNHLLGIGAWDSSLVDIGIGFAVIEKNGRKQFYVSVLIAKHNW